MVVTVIVPPVIAPAMIPPVMAIPCAHDDSRAVVNRRGRRGVVDGRGGVVHRWGYDYWRCHSDADPDVNIGLRGYGEPRRQQRRAEKKVPCLEFHMRPHSKLFKSGITFDNTALRGVLHLLACTCCISQA
jgi:hypothetical protein